MSLFVGNVSKHVSNRELEALFKKFGKCKIDLRDRYAFVQFDNTNNAEAAKKELQNQSFHGLQLNIEWSKNSGRFGQNNKKRDGAGGGNSSQVNQRRRSRSRQNRWRRDDRWGRRSPSNERSSPSYDGNSQFQTFVPVCPRDEIILKKLIAKAKQRQNRHKESHRKDHDSQKNISVPVTTQTKQQDDKNVEMKGQGEIIAKNEKFQHSKIQEQEGIVHEDGEIPLQQ